MTPKKKTRRGRKPKEESLPDPDVTTCFNGAEEPPIRNKCSGRLSPDIINAPYGTTLKKTVEGPPPKKVCKIAKLEVIPEKRSEDSNCGMATKETQTEDLCTGESGMLMAMFDKRLEDYRCRMVTKGTQTEDLCAGESEKSMVVPDTPQTETIIGNVLDEQSNKPSRKEKNPSEEPGAFLHETGGNTLEEKPEERKGKQMKATAAQSPDIIDTPYETTFKETLEGPPPKKVRKSTKSKVVPVKPTEDTTRELGIEKPQTEEMCSDDKSKAVPDTPQTETTIGNALEEGLNKTRMEKKPVTEPYLLFLPETRGNTLEEKPKKRKEKKLKQAVAVPDKVAPDKTIPYLTPEERIANVIKKVCEWREKCTEFSEDTTYDMEIEEHKTEKVCMGVEDTQIEKLCTGEQSQELSERALTTCGPADSSSEQKPQSPEPIGLDKAKFEDLLGHPLTHHAGVHMLKNMVASSSTSKKIDAQAGSGEMTVKDNAVAGPSSKLPSRVGVTNEGVGLVNELWNRYERNKKKALHGDVEPKKFCDDPDDDDYDVDAVYKAMVDSSDDEMDFLKHSVPQYDLKKQLCDRHYSAIKKMTRNEIVKATKEVIPILKGIFDGTVPSKRHEIFKKCGLSRMALYKIAIAEPFSDDHHYECSSTIMCALSPDGILEKKNGNFMNYVSDVLVPECFIRIYSKVNNVSIEFAEKELRLGPKYDGKLDEELIKTIRGAKDSTDKAI